MDEFLDKAGVFFSLFSYPLLPIESFRYQWGTDFSLSYFVDRQLNDPMDISDNELWKLRLKRYRISLQKIKKGVRLAKFLRYAPFVRGVAIASTLSYFNARPFADIDLFVIYEGDKGWVARFYCLLLSLFFGRPGRVKTKRSPACFNFYLSRENLNLKFLKIDQDDVYLFYWVTQLFPVYGDGIWKEFWAENIEWVSAGLSRAYPTVTVSSLRALSQAKEKSIAKNLLEKIFSLKMIGSLLANIEWAWLPLRLKALANNGMSVVLGRHVLKFHPQDKREFYLKKWKSLSEDSR